MVQSAPSQPTRGTARAHSTKHRRVRKMDGFGGIRDVSAEITAEINSLDANFPHASRLLKEGAYLPVEALAKCTMARALRACVVVGPVAVTFPAWPLLQSWRDIKKSNQRR